MNIDLSNPESIGMITNLPAMTSKISLPGMNGQEGSMMCFTDNDGSDKCFVHDGKNEVKCNGDDCFVTFNTLSQKLSGNGGLLRKLGIDVLVIPGGLSTSTILVGNVPRKKISALKKIVGERINVVESESLPLFTSGIPEPPRKCNLNPLSSECSPYLSSDDWVYVPVIGFKRRVDVFKNPGTIFKSNIVPEIKKIKDISGMLFRKNKTNSTNEIDAVIPPVTN